MNCRLCADTGLETKPWGTADPCRCAAGRQLRERENERKRPLPGHCIAVYLELFEHPGLLQSRHKDVEYSTTFEDCRVKVGRFGRRGMSPKLAQLAKLIMYEAMRSGTPVEDDYGRYYRVLIPEPEARQILGRTSYITSKELDRIADSISFVLWLKVFGRPRSAFPDYDRRGVMPIPIVRRAAERGHIEAWANAGVVNGLRERRDSEVRIIQRSALPVLASLDAVTAGLAQWLAPRWHGRKYCDQPLRCTLDELYHDITGGELTADGSRRRFRSELHQSAATINAKDVLALLELDQPRRVDLTFEAKTVVLNRGT